MLDLKKIKKAILNNKNKAIAGAGLMGVATIGGIAVALNESKNHNDNPETSIGTNIDDENEIIYDYVVQYQYTNEYKEFPQNNKIQILNENDVVIITDNSHIAQGGYYNLENNVWQEVNKENAKIQTPWIKGRVESNSLDVNQQNEGFMPFEYVDIYAPYKATAKLNFRSEPNTQKGKENVITQIQTSEDVYIFENSDVIEYDNHIWKQALVKLNEKYEHGYIATDTNAIERDFLEDNIGLINTNTFLRTTPIVSELDESIITGQVENGKKLKIIETHYGENDLWHKCLLEGESQYVYLSDVTIKPISEFKTQIELPTNIASITNKDGSVVRKNINKGSILKVDSENVFNGKYEVMFESEEGCTIGYMDATSLGLPPTLAIMTDTEMNIPNITSATSIQTQTQIPIQTETQSVTQTTTETTGKDKLVYQLDIGWAANNPDAFIKNIDEFKQKDEIAGVYFEIGISSRTSSNQEKLFMQTLGDDDEEFLLGESEDVHLIATDVVKLKQKCTKGRIENGTEYLGKITNLEKCIKAAIDNDIPVGLYYYQGAADSNRASAEAAYIYSVIKKLKYDMGGKYINAKKLPIMIDIEKTYSAAALDEERLEAMNKTIRLLGKGENTDDCWTLNGEKSYNVLNDYNNQVTLYFDINGNNQGLGYRDVTLIRKIDELKQNGYRTIINTTRNVDGLHFEGDYKDLYDKEEMYNKMKQNRYYIEIPEIVAMSDIIQCGLDMYKNGNAFDFSLTTQNTIVKIVNGTYMHDENYFDKIQNVLNKEKNITNTIDERG